MRVREKHEMKDSGIEWIGEIPRDWNSVRLKYLCSINTGNKDTINRKDDGLYPFYVRSPKVERIDTYTYDGEAILMAGDGVGAGRVFHYVDGKFDYHQRVYNLHKIECNGKLLYYYLSENFYKEIEQSNAKSTVDSIRLPMITDFPVVICNDEKGQREITTYLDQKCNKIDFAIEKQNELIEKLKEYKQSIITEAVTKGLDKDVPMKDSGVEWIGDVPDGWGIVPLHQYYIEHKNKNYGNKETNVLSLSYGSIVKRDVETNMGLLPASFETYNIVEPNNIVLRLTDLQNDKKSLRTGLVKQSGIITSAYLTLEAIDKESDSRFNHYLLHSYDITKVIYNMGNGVRQNLKFDELKKMPLVVPSNEEQLSIAEYLDVKCTQIDKAIEEKQKLIDKLTEYKKSLIYEVVTGKVEV